MKLAHAIALAIGGLLLAYGLVSGLLLNRQIQDRLLREQSAWALSLTKAMAEGIVRDTLNGDALQVRETLRNIARAEDRVAYAYVINFEGRLFAHSFDDGFPKALSQLKYPSGKNSMVLATGQGHVLNIGYPLVEGTDATLHLGISLVEPERLAKDLQHQHFFVLAGTGLIAFLLAIYLGRQLSRPLDRLVEAMRHFGGGQLVAPPALPHAGREIRALNQTFNQMMVDRATLEAALQRANAELEVRVQARTAELAAANKELEAFSYSVSHDLRAPLRAVDGFSQALLEDYGDQLDSTGKNYLQRVRNGAQNMGALIDDMLKLSRVTRAPLQPTEVDFSAMAHEIAAQLRHGETGRDICINIAEGLRAYGDPGLLHVVLDNLLDNAWKYTSKTAAAHISFDAVERDGETVFFVRDNGAGFDMKFAGKLFGAFQRLHRRDEFEGTGVGLATTARIIHRHSGRVWAEAEPGKGATFYFTLVTPI